MAKLSQFNFPLTSANIALYPHCTEHVVKNGRKKNTFYVKRPDECHLVIVNRKTGKVHTVSYTHLTLPTILLV